MELNGSYYRTTASIWNETICVHLISSIFLHFLVKQCSDGISGLDCVFVYPLLWELLWCDMILLLLVFFPHLHLLSLSLSCSFSPCHLLRRGSDLEWVIDQEQTFITWLNKTLQGSEYSKQMTDLRQDLSDGLALIHLVKVFSPESIRFIKYVFEYTTLTMYMIKWGTIFTYTCT